MQLFYAPELDPDTGSYVFSEEESKHCVRVLRLGAGDSLHLTDGRCPDQKYRPVRVVRREGDRDRRRPYRTVADRSLRASHAQDRPVGEGGYQCRQTIAQGLSSGSRAADAAARMGRTAVRRGEADRPLRKGYAAPFYRATHLSGKPCDGADRARRRFFARRDRISPSVWVCRYLFGA